jgi:hypothetical protein
MATTTNYGWTTPDDTALVKDGAAAIRTLGTSVDTTTKNLNPSTTLGDIEYRSSTANTNTRLGIGSTGHVLTVAAGVPSWAALPAAGGMTLIGETVASASASVSFTSISGSYKQLLLVWQGIYHAEVHYNWGIRLNNDSGNNYSGINMGFVNSTAGIQVFDSSDCSATQIGGAQYSPFGFGTTSSTLEDRASGFFLLDNYSSSTKLKCYNMTFKYRRGSAGDYYYCNTTGTYDSTTAITQLNIFGNGGTISNATNTSIRLYGLS